MRSVTKPKLRDIPESEQLLVAQRFWDKVASSASRDACWEWRGGKSGQGYGRFRIKGRLHSAHRVAWILEYGEIQEGAVIRHDCDNPSCCNPYHLSMGTQAENVQDQVNKNRHPRQGGRPKGIPKGPPSTRRVSRKIEGHTVFDREICQIVESDLPDSHWSAVLEVPVSVVRKIREQFEGGQRTTDRLSHLCPTDKRTVSK